MSKSVTAGDSLRNAFGNSLVELADKYDFSVFDADVCEGVGLKNFRHQYPARFFQMGIAEQAMVCAAAGWSMASGKKAFCSTFAAFGARAFEQFRLSVAYNQADVVLALSHTGLDVGPDSVSAQSLEHIGLWTSLPGVAVIQPATPAEMREAVEWLVAEHRGPAVLFTGRSTVEFDLPEDYHFKYGIPKVVASKNNYGWDTIIFATGQAVGVAMEAVNKFGAKADVVNISTLSNIKESIICSLVGEHELVVTIEDHGHNGLHSLIASKLAQVGNCPPVLPIRVNGWGESGEAGELYQKYGLTGEAVAERIKEWIL